MLLYDYVKKRPDKKVLIRLRDMKTFFSDKKAVNKRLKENPLIYTVLIKELKEIEYAITIIESGEIGKEHFMTRGHYHKKAYPEIYILVKGKGILLLQNKKFEKIRMRKGKAIYVHPKYAHRAVNMGWKKLEFLSIYSPKSGHNYKSIEKKGFRKRL
jgi:glucose-6-phosphate isomerase